MCVCVCVCVCACVRACVRASTVRVHASVCVCHVHEYMMGVLLNVRACVYANLPRYLCPLHSTETLHCTWQSVMVMLMCLKSYWTPEAMSQNRTMYVYVSQFISKARPLMISGG